MYYIFHAMCCFHMMLSGIKRSNAPALQVRKSARGTAGNHMKENMEALAGPKAKKQSQGTAKDMKTRGQRRDNEESQQSGGHAEALGRLTQSRMRRGLPSIETCVPETELQAQTPALADFN